MSPPVVKSALRYAVKRIGNAKSASLQRRVRRKGRGRATMIIDTECKVVNDPCRAERLVWAELGGVVVLRVKSRNTGI